MQFFKRSLWLVMVGLVTWVAIFHLVPTWRPHLDEEDHLAENVTVVLLGLTFLMGLFTLFRLNGKKERLLTAGLTVLVGLGLGDELSYGERFFEMTLPTIGETKIDGVHDIVQVVWDVKWAVVLIAVVASGLGWRHRHYLVRQLKEASKGPVWQPLILVGAFVTLALFFDLHIIEFPARHAVEEYFELLAAAFLCVGMIRLCRFGLKPIPTGELELDSTVSKPVSDSAGT